MNAPQHAPHYPNPPDSFIFDRAVAPIFPSMAERSIPNYHAAHALHAAIALDGFLDHGSKVLDIGASRAGFVKHLKTQIERAHSLEIPRNLQITATDISPDMCSHMAADFPDIEVVQEDIRSQEFFGREEKYDVVNCSYVIQFVPPDEQVRVLRKVASLVKKGGVLFLGQKEQSPGVAGNLLHNSYIQFRLANGYSREEIRRKTEALANSMWPINYESMLSELRHQGFSEVVGTTRAGVFSTVMCVR